MSLTHEIRSCLLNRRRFLTLGIAGATSVACTAVEQQYEAASSLGNVIDTRTNELLFDREVMRLGNQLRTQQRFSNYSGPHRFELVPKNQDESELINTLVTGYEKILNHVFGEPPGWTANETTAIVQDDRIMSLFNRVNRGTYALFINGNTTPFLHDRFNAIVYPSTFIDAIRHNIPWSYFALLHEMTHAYTQHKQHLPKIWHEGLADMVGILGILNLYPQIAGQIEHDYDVYAARMNQEKLLNGKHFGTIQNRFATVAAAGYVLYGWYKEHRDFFRDLRLYENDFHNTHERIPTFAEWKQLGNEVESEFAEWIDSQPVLNIPD